MRKAKVLLLISCVTAGIGFTGCRSGAPSAQNQSQIVKEVEAAGSGPLEGLDQLTIQRWLNGHQDVAKRIAPECKGVGPTRPAAWATTTEGIVCTADAQVMFTMPTHLYKSY